jgi:diguanylate cyclase (GGDEF)-like protein/PAS domain S-box-containing protein
MSRDESLALCPEHGQAEMTMGAADQVWARHTEEALRRVNSLFEDAIAYSPTYIYEVDAEGRFTFIKGCDKVLGYSEAELLGRRFGEVRCRDVACREHRDALDDAFRARRHYEQVLTCAVHKDGTHLWLSASGHPMVDAEGRFTGYRGVGFDITETTNSRKELERLALMDPLTGLANRRKFMERFRLEAERQDRHGQPLSLLVVDVDHFKGVNDQFGHLTGDLCLKCIADLLALGVRKIDLVARFGGEEFLILLPETGPAGATIVAEKLRMAIESLNVPLESRFEPLSVTVSIGVATRHSSQSLSFDDLMAIADQGLYQAKRGGRNRVMGAT